MPPPYLDGTFYLVSSIEEEGCFPWELFVDELQQALFGNIEADVLWGGRYPPVRYSYYCYPKVARNERERKPDVCYLRFFPQFFHAYFTLSLT
jgi:hypothetical protein